MLCWATGQEVILSLEDPGVDRSALEDPEISHLDSQKM